MDIPAPGERGILPRLADVEISIDVLVSDTIAHTEALERIEVAINALIEYDNHLAEVQTFQQKQLRDLYYMQPRWRRAWRKLLGRVRGNS